MNSLHVKDFLSGYFHEDWPIEANTDAGIVLVYLRSGVTKPEILALASELETVAREQERAATEEWLNTLYGCYYLPSVDSLTGSAWLRRLAELLRNGVIFIADSPYAGEKR